MATVVLACRTLEAELREALANTDSQCSVKWIESGLHNVPKHLRNRIQQELDACPEEIDTVLMAMSFCGNSVSGLCTQDFSLVIPRCDDCIDLLMGSVERRREEYATYFLTEGWLRGERNIWSECRMTLEKYGEKRGRRIIRAMLGHYRNLAYLDTGLDIPKTEETIQAIAKEIGLEYMRITGTLEYLERLLTGPWDKERFLVVPPRSSIKEEDLSRKEG